MSGDLPERRVGQVGRGDDDLLLLRLREEAVAGVGGEDAVLQPIEALGPSIATELRARPAAESPLQALRSAFDVAAASVAADPATITTVMRLNRSEPALRGRHLHKQDLWTSALAEAMGERLGLPGDSPVIRMQCAAMMLAWEKALVSCYERDDFSRAGEELDTAISDLRSFLAS
ncbi:hypothetical protein AB0P05_45200 [Streptomyces flaveolus]|uniref:acyl-CoA-like ligand-binding transcription factor n=1 Tax=Streptomyces flaveolus TaxID=67297 RepID=UPI00344AD38A